MFDAMKAAATKRVEGLLAGKWRRHYGHAASLVACCVELSPTVGKEEAVTDWTEEMRRRHSRFYGFQTELKSALASTAPDAAARGAPRRRAGRRMP